MCIGDGVRRARFAYDLFVEERNGWHPARDQRHRRFVNDCESGQAGYGGELSPIGEDHLVFLHASRATGQLKLSAQILSFLFADHATSLVFAHPEAF